jgi:hypothetical protein
MTDTASDETRPRVLACPQCRRPLPIGERDLRGNWRAVCASCGGWWCSLGDAVEAGYLPESSLRRLPPGTAMLRCPSCDRLSLAPIPAVRAVALRPMACAECRYVWLPQATREAIRPTARSLLDAAAGSSGTGIAARIAQSRRPALQAAIELENHPLLHAIAVPLVVLIVWLLVRSPWGEFFQRISVGMIAHELGHALAALLSGTWAIPLPFITLTLGGHAWSAVLAVGAGIAWVLWSAVRKRLPARFCLGLLLLLGWLTHAIGGDAAAREEWIVYMGIGGEFALGAVLMLAFFHRLHDAPAWDLVRFACLVVGTTVFVPALLFWGDVAAGIRELPMGSALRGGDDPGGDIDRLLAMGWTAPSLIASYRSLGYWCAMAIALHWMLVAWRGWATRHTLGEAWERLGSRR